MLGSLELPGVLWGSRLAQYLRAAPVDSSRGRTRCRVTEMCLLADDRGNLGREAVQLLSQLEDTGRRHSLDGLREGSAVELREATLRISSS